MTEVAKIDEIDRNIIQIIQEDPSLTHTQIAKKVNRSQPTIGMRIRKLEEMGVLKYQAGVNIKSADLVLAQVQVQTLNPERIISLIKKCPFLLNGFIISGTSNISVLIAAYELQNLEQIVNFHFRSKGDVTKVTMDIITNVVNDFVVPIDLHFDDCDCWLNDICTSED